jgi:hypothetical protein
MRHRKRVGGKVGTIQTRERAKTRENAQCITIRAFLRQFARFAFNLFQAFPGESLGPQCDVGIDPRRADGRSHAREQRHDCQHPDHGHEHDRVVRRLVEE